MFKMYTIIILTIHKKETIIIIAIALWLLLYPVNYRTTISEFLSLLEYGILQFEYIVKHFKTYSHSSTYNPNNKEYDHLFPQIQYCLQAN